MGIGRKVQQPESVQQVRPEYRNVDGKLLRIVYETDNALHHVKSFVDKYERGKRGESKSIPMGFKRLTRYFGIRKQVYYLVGGNTGSGKTTLVDDAFILNPTEWFMKNNRDPNLDFHVLHFTMERSKDYKIARWLSRKIFLETGVIITIGAIMGWDGPPTKEQQILIDMYTPFINELLDKHITIFEGPINPTGIYKKVKDFAYRRGHDEKVIVIRKDGSEYTKTVYVADKPNEVVMVILDTINLVKTGEGVFEFDESTQKRRLVKTLDDKGTLDKTSEYMMWFRDYLGYSPLAISQFNRSISNPIRLKMGNVQPELEDFKGSGDTQDDAEIVFALFDPMRYKVDDIYGYNLNRLKEGPEDSFPGSKKYRQLAILKNTYGPDDVGVGLGYQPQVGYFKELPFPSEMNDDAYAAVINNEFFRW